MLILGRAVAIPGFVVFDFVIRNKSLYTEASRRSTSELLLWSFRELPLGGRSTDPDCEPVVDWETAFGVNLDEVGVLWADVETRFFLGIGPKRRFKDASFWPSAFFVSLT
jgi:hypothetical protein